MSNIITATMGDPAGIGSEIIIKSLAGGALGGAPVVVVGCAQTLRWILALNITSRAELRITGRPTEACFSPATTNVIDESLSDSQGLHPDEVRAQVEDPAFRYIRRAIALALDGVVVAIAAAPLSKEALHLAGHAFPGHTELLARLTQTTDYTVVLHIEKFKVIHIITHIAPHQFLDALNQSRIEAVIDVTDRSLRRVGYQRPRITIASVNPHVEENSPFGGEEARVVAPAVVAMQAQGIEVTDPRPPDTVLMQCHEGMCDMVMVVHHGQGHTPLKLFGFYDEVNITAGLPLIRTSADHGTALDIAWTGKAKSESMATSTEFVTHIAQE